MPHQLLFWQEPNGLCARGEVCERVHELMNEVVQLEQNTDKNSETSPMQIPFFHLLRLFVFFRIYMEAFFPSQGCTILIEEAFFPLLGLQLLFLRSSIVRHQWVTFLVTFVLPWMFKEQ